MSADGKIALPNRSQMRISSDEDMKRVYHLRNQCDAVLVGIGTVLADDPKLTVKKSLVPNPSQPLRVVLDAKGRIPSTALVVNNDAKTMIFTTSKHKDLIKVNYANVYICPEEKPGFLDLTVILETLYDNGVKSLLVEGGSTVIWSFFRQNLVDEFYVYIAPFIIGGERTPTVAGGKGIVNEKEKIQLRLCDIQKMDIGVLLHYTR